MQAGFLRRRGVAPPTARRRQQRADRGRRAELRFELVETRDLLSVTTAIQSGAWNELGTWSAGVPDSTVRAVIPSGVSVTLAGTDHVAKELVIQGTLSVAETENADFDSNEAMNGIAFLIWQQGLGTAFPAATRQTGDADGDLDVDGDDLNVWEAQYAAEVPELSKTLTTDWIHVNSGGVFQFGPLASVVLPAASH